MRRCSFLVLLAFLSWSATGCGKGSPTGPSALNLTGVWSGTWIDTLGGASTGWAATLTLTQTGSRIAGNGSVYPPGQPTLGNAHTFDGTLANGVVTMVFTWSLPGCSGNGTMNLTATANTLAGGYTGGTTCFGPGNVGQVSFTKQ